ncbi:MAG: hypothetical protein O2960_13105 [Verrucomicrobia bacterium]|nr:hypothetical protein [Verrucomicrobiota bacterium]
MLTTFFLTRTVPHANVEFISSGVTWSAVYDLRAGSPMPAENVGLTSL